MKIKLFISLINILILFGCMGIDFDKVSDNTLASPNISLPLGKIEAQYEDFNSLPVAPPPGLEPVSFTVSDTIYYRWNETKMPRSEIIYMMLRFDSENRFPAEVEIGLYHRDDIFGDLTAINYEPIVLPPARIGLGGTLVSATTDLTDIMLDEAQTGDLISADTLVIIMNINDLVLSQQVIDNLHNYSVRSAIGVQALVRINIDNF